jgi:hypothetical protein
MAVLSTTASASSHYPCVACTQAGVAEGKDEVLDKAVQHPGN